MSEHLINLKEACEQLRWVSDLLCDAKQSNGISRSKELVDSAISILQQLQSCEEKLRVTNRVLEVLDNLKETSLQIDSPDLLEPIIAKMVESADALRGKFKTEAMAA